VLGVGEDYIRQQSVQDDTTESLAAQENDLSQYHNVLMSVAAFFMKRGFRHVSILDGGFSAAARHLLRQDSPFKLSTSLVDINPESLDRLLGPGTCERHLAIKKTVRPSATSASLLDPHKSGDYQSEGSTAAGIMNLSSMGSFVASLGAITTPSNQDTPHVSSAAVLEDIGKKFTMFGSSTFATLKKSVNTVGAMGVVAAVAGAGYSTNTAGSGSDHNGDRSVDSAAHEGSTWRDVDEEGKNSLTFVIDEEEEDDSQHDRKASPESSNASRLAASIPDTHKVNVSRSEAEKKQALALHKLSGVRKGDQVVICRDTFPGAVLFPAMKEKEVKDEAGQLIMVPGPDGETLQPVTSSIHRYLVITKERFIVLDSNGLGVGATAIVKSNHHLTELVKITFKKRDPELVTLFISSPGTPASYSGEEGVKKHQYRVAKRKDFVTTLQVRAMTPIAFIPSLLSS
jgi:hypothetical protein